MMEKQKIYDQITEILLYCFQNKIEFKDEQFARFEYGRTGTLLLTEIKDEEQLIVSLIQDLGISDFTYKTYADIMEDGQVFLEGRNGRDNLLYIDKKCFIRYMFHISNVSRRKKLTKIKSKI